MPKVSIIVPVYNTEKYLPRCIDSILTQTFTDFELILIDDGSTDCSSKICDDYANKDTRIVVIHKENGGAGAARNKGISIAKGDWVVFIDADDFVSNKYVEDLYNDVFFDSSIDLVIHGFNKQINCNFIEYSTKQSQIYDNLNHLWNDLNIFKFCGPYCKLFKTSIINKFNISYNPDIVCAEDYDFLLKYILYCKKIKVSENQNYYYISHSNSVSSKIYSFDIEYSSLKHLDKTYHRLIKSIDDNEKILLQYNKFISYYIYRVIISIYSGERTSKDRILMLNSIDKSYIYQFDKYWKAETLFLWIIKQLIVLHQYKLVDLILCKRLSL